MSTRANSVDLTDTICRGRNGWFKGAVVGVAAVPAEIDCNERAHVEVQVASKRAWEDMPPIYMNLSVDDARALAFELHRALNKLGSTT